MEVGIKFAINIPPIGIDIRNGVHTIEEDADGDDDGYGCFSNV